MKQWKILVVDDEATNRYIIEEYLESDSYQLVCVESALEGWEKLNEPAATYDLVILDRMMPQMDGLALLKKLRADERFRALPVIMQTAAASPREVAEGIEAGAYYYLTKPYERKALTGIVRALIADIEERASVSERIVQQTDALNLVMRAELRFSTLDDAQRVAGLLAVMTPEPGAAALALSELLVNAVEHGNLGITYAEKARMRTEGTWEEEVARRLQLPELRDRVVTVELERREEEIVFCVTDQGTGFDWRPYLDFAPERACDPNGRGIAMARRMALSRLEYRGCGNVVEAALALGRQRA